VVKDHDFAALTGVLRRIRPTFESCKSLIESESAIRRALLDGRGKAELLNQEKTMARQAIWKSIAQSSPKQLIAGYTELIQQRIDEGFGAFLLTFMFKQLAGPPKALRIQMNDEVQRVYSTFVTRVVRNPRSEFLKDALPFLITVPDRPVSKKNKQNLSDLAINGGLHLHGILCVPGNSRLKVDAAAHFNANKALYVKKPFAADQHKAGLF
jgi:hypothetical protein